MNKHTWETVTDSAEATESLGERIGARLHGGEAIEFVSDLGGGKTTFVRGLARGLGSTDRVASPTFTISRAYKAGDRALLHFDFYRLNEAGIMADELAESLADPKAVVVVEWGDIVADVLPDERITVTITAAGESQRAIRIQYPSTLDYIRAEENS